MRCSADCADFLDAPDWRDWPPRQAPWLIILAGGLVVLPGWARRAGARDLSAASRFAAKPPLGCACQVSVLECSIGSGAATDHGDALSRCAVLPRRYDVLRLRNELGVLKP